MFEDHVARGPTALVSGRYAVSGPSSALGFVATSQGLSLP